MADYSDIKNLCREYSVKIINTPSSDGYDLRAFRETRVLHIAGTYMNPNDSDTLFDIIRCIGWIVVKAKSKYEKEKESVIWAIEQASILNIHISSLAIDRIQKNLDNYHNREKYQYNFDSVTLDQSLYTLGELLARYKMPLCVQKTSWTADFYFQAESIDSQDRICGTAFKDGRKYNTKSYKFKASDTFRLYGDNNTPIPLDPDIDYNDTIKKRIKSKDGFAEVYTNDTFLLNYQKAGLQLSERYPKFAFFFDTGTGKTIMTLAIIKKKFEENRSHFLIIAPKPVIKNAWLEDSSNHFPSMTIMPLSNNFSFQDYKSLYDRWLDNDLIPTARKIPPNIWEAATYYGTWTDEIEKARNDIKETMVKIADHYIVNIEKYRMDPYKFIDQYPVTGLVIDESAILKSPDSMSAKAMLGSADNFEYIYLLSGKPAPNNSTEYYAQMKLVDPNTFCMSFKDFKSLLFSGHGTKGTISTNSGEKTVAEMISRRSLTVSKEDCLSLPEILHEKILLNLPDDTMEKYDQLFRYCMIEIEKQESLHANASIAYSAPCRLAVLAKLRELASGFMMDDYHNIADVHGEKLKALLSLIERNKEEQMVIWCQFEHEIRTIEKALKPYGKVVTAYGKTKNLDQNIAMFRDQEAKYIIAHPKSVKYGLTFTNCCISVYYSMSYSAEDYYQSRDRIYRLGQKRNCTYYYLLSKDTIDEIMYECVLNKMSYAELFSEIVKAAAKHGIDYSGFKHDEAPDESISTQIIKNDFVFTIVDGNLFTFRYKKEAKEGLLYNKMLADKKALDPEEILFEIGYVVLLEDKDRVSYADVTEVAKWVLQTMKDLKIRRISKVYNYLEEQILKQYETDVANGADDVLEIESLSAEEIYNKFSFGKLK